MGGKIGLAASDRCGSEFWFTLPLDDGAPPREAPYPLEGMRIGIVSSSAMLRGGLKLQLAASGADIVEISPPDGLHEHRMRCDAVLIDMTERDREKLPGLATLGLCAVAVLPPDNRANLAALGPKGFRGYLTKPVRHDSLEIGRAHV